MTIQQLPGCPGGNQCYCPVNVNGLLISRAILGPDWFKYRYPLPPTPPGILRAMRKAKKAKELREKSEAFKTYIAAQSVFKPIERG